MFVCSLCDPVTNASTELADIEEIHNHMLIAHNDYVM